MEEPHNMLNSACFGKSDLIPQQETAGDLLINLPAFLFCAALLGLSLLTMRGKSLLWPQQDQKNNSRQTLPIEDTGRCIIQRMTREGKECVVLFGSQTGNAQDLAERLAKEGHSRFGLETMVADLEDFDYETLDRFPQDKTAIFVLSSYGEGEPTDNAVGFYNYFVENDGAASISLENMKYAIFGLGNSTYEHYNAVARRIDKALEHCGAKRIGTLGEADDAKGSTEDDFLTWKEAMWGDMKSLTNMQERETRFEPAFLVEERAAAEPDSVFLGERCKDELEGRKPSHPGPHNPTLVKITACRELFTSKERNCLHMELEIGSADLEYQTGDHAAVWPMNSDLEVDRFLRVFGLLDKRDTTIFISSISSASRLSFPTPTTYDAAARYYLEIGGPIFRQFLLTMAEFATDPEQKEILTKLSKNKEYFAKVVSDRYLNLAQLIETICPSNPVCTIPFNVLIEGVRTLQPRYYSISSSSIVQKSNISITAVVESVNLPGDTCFKGVATNYLLALKQQVSKESKTKSPKSHLDELSYTVSGPRGKYNLSLPIHIRHSSFRLPSDLSRPVIMVGPGTGAAPFRAFVQERAAQAHNGVSVGNMILFFGCRKESEDYIYKDEWETLKSKLKNRFQIYTAFSRQGKHKVYVQDRLVEHAAEVTSSLVDQNGSFFICGDARMARQVQTTLAGILSKTESEGELILKNMKSQGRFQEDVW